MDECRARNREFLDALRKSIMEDWRFDGLTLREWWERAYDAKKPESEK